VISHRHTALMLKDWTASRTLSVVVNGITIDAGALWAMRGGAAEVIEWLRGDLIPTARNCDSLGIPKSVKL
jgi:hypothetical protein